MTDRSSPTLTRRVPTPSSSDRTLRGRIFTVLGSRADPGVPGIAARLAHALHARSGGEIALVELDPRAVRARGTRRIRRPSPRPNDDGTPGDDPRLAMPGASTDLVWSGDGLWTLAPSRTRTPVLGDAKAVIAAIEAMRARFPVGVIELEPQVSERTLAAFDAADRIVLVTDGTVPSLRRAQRVLRLCRRLHYPDEKMCLVASHVGLPGAMPPADIAAALRRELFWKLGDDTADIGGLAARLVDQDS